MKGFLVAFAVWVLVTFGCSATFLAGNVNLTLPLLLVFYLASLATAFAAGRGVDLQSPVRPRGERTADYRRAPAPVKQESLLNRARRKPVDEFN